MTFGGKTHRMRRYLEADPQSCRVRPQRGPCWARPCTSPVLPRQRTHDASRHQVDTLLEMPEIPRTGDGRWPSAKRTHSEYSKRQRVGRVPGPAAAREATCLPAIVGDTEHSSDLRGGVPIDSQAVRGASPPQRRHCAGALRSLAATALRSAGLTARLGGELKERQEERGELKEETEEREKERTEN
eukprot:Skav211690  [mRNA]  locus=scaffold216:578065:583062:- [translate_table: standard]